MMNIKETHDSRLKTQDSRLKTQDSGLTINCALGLLSVLFIIQRATEKSQMDTEFIYKNT